MGKQFFDAMATVHDDVYNRSVTENGAVGFKTTGKNLLDLNFGIASMRSSPEDHIGKTFLRAFIDNRVTAMKWLFFARDVRGGLGERRFFRAAILALSNTYPEYVTPLISLIPEYGRWDDLFCLLDSDNTSVRGEVLRIISEQLYADMAGCKNGAPISLLGKWLPSIKSKKLETRHQAFFIYSAMHMSRREYQCACSMLRKHLDIVERRMSNGQWDEIKYEAVPSKANLRYNKAFLRHDEERRREYLDAVNKGEAKINAATLFPHDIVNKYRRSSTVDDTLEALWRELPDTVNGCGNTIVVSDESGSMTWVTLPNSTARPLEVAESLAIYFAERSSGQFKNRFITFSNDPRLIDMSAGKTLRDKLTIVRSGRVGGSTNVEAVFNLILDTAIQNHMAQEDIPQNILIISDMEFNECATGNGDWGNRDLTPRLFEVIAQKYTDAGYQLPRLVFWNVASRTGTIPIKENKMGVALVSGFSPNIARMVMSGQTDPYACLLETINTPRYQPVEDVLSSLST